MSCQMCENCYHYSYDEEYDCMVCDRDLDEDEMHLFLTGRTDRCPYYDFGDEYAIVRKQN